MNRVIKHYKGSKSFILSEILQYILLKKKILIYCSNWDNYYCKLVRCVKQNTLFAAEDEVAHCKRDDSLKVRLFMMYFVVKTPHVNIYLIQEPHWFDIFMLYSDDCSR